MVLSIGELCSARLKNQLDRSHIEQSLKIVADIHSEKRLA